MVGKTSITTRFIKGKFMKIEVKNRTINASCFLKSVEVNNKLYNLNIWDTAGEEKYHALAPIFFRGAQGAVIIFDITNRETFNRAKKWFNELKQYTEGNPQIILVGNKIDLPNKAITNEEATKLAREYNCKFLEVSALLGTNVNEIFYNLADAIHQQRKKDRKEKMDNFDEVNSGSNSNYGSNRGKKLQIDDINENHKTTTNNRKDSCC